MCSTDDNHVAGLRLIECSAACMPRDKRQVLSCKDIFVCVCVYTHKQVDTKNVRIMNQSDWMLSEQKYQVYTQTFWDLEN